MASLDSLRDLFVDELRDIYSAEQQLLKALPKISKSANNPRLTNALDQHLRQTKEHARRLETIFEQLGERARGKRCKGMEGLLEEGKEVMDTQSDDDTRDAAIIGAAQRVEHYEIAAYGTACAHARVMGTPEVEQLLQQTLDEEKDADRLLTEIAESGVNEWAAEGEGERAGMGNGGMMGGGMESSRRSSAASGRGGTGGAGSSARGRQTARRGSSRSTPRSVAVTRRSRRGGTTRGGTTRGGTTRGGR